MAKKNCCVFVMQKNERHLLPLFFKYHAKIVGAPNIFIFDNGSDAEMLPILRVIENLGGQVIFKYSAREDFESKGSVFTQFVKELEADYETFIPLDCDEFLALETTRKLVINPQLISNEIQNLEVGISSVRGRWRAHPFSKRLVARNTEGDRLPKLLFKKHLPQNLDLGFHFCDGSSLAANTRLAYLEFHYRPLEMLKVSVKQKMEDRFDDSGKPVFPDGRGHHLVPEMKLENKTEYEKFLDQFLWQDSAAPTELLNLLQVSSIFDLA